MKKIVIILLAVTTLMACERRHKQDVLMLYPNWTDGIALTYLAKVVLEEKGYTVDLKRLEPGPIYAALSRGDADVYMAGWLPYTHEYYWNRFGDRLDIGGVVFENGISGLVVPTYVDINSIEELNANKDKFEGGKIYGIGAGAGIHNNTERAIVEYGLEYQQISSSETSMLAATRKAVASNGWIVITGWKPHQKWIMFDLKPLEDPKGVYPTDEIRIVTRAGFAGDQPEIANFFRNLQLDDDLLAELIDGLADERDPEVAVRRFYNKYRDMLDAWIVEKKVK